MSIETILEDRLRKPEFEVAVLAAVMTVSQVAEQSNELTENLFTSEANKILLQAIHALHKSGVAVDALTVSEKVKDLHLDQDGKIEKYIMDVLSNSSTSLFNYPVYLAQLRELSDRRELRAVAERAVIIANDLSVGTAETAISKVSEMVSSVCSKSTASDNPEHIVNSITDLRDEIDLIQRERIAGTYRVRGVNTGSIALDNKLGEVQNGDLVFIAARPSMGKTALAQNIATHIATNLVKPVLFESIEMKREKIARRLCAAIGGINLQNLYSANMNGDSWERFNSAAQIVDKAPFCIMDGSVTVFDIRRHARYMKARFGSVGAIFIDYLQLISTPQFSSNVSENERLTFVSRNLKQIAMDFDCPVFCLSQLSRDVEKRPNKRPLMSDLRGSGAIEQDADVVMFIYRDEYYNKESKHIGIAEIIIGKCRDGVVGTAYMATELEYSRFSDVDSAYMALEGGDTA